MTTVLNEAPVLATIDDETDTSAFTPSPLCSMKSVPAWSANTDPEMVGELSAWIHRLV